MICDPIVVGVRNQVLSQRMQLDPDLTLEKAKTFSCQKEAVREHQQILKSSIGVGSSSKSPQLIKFANQARRARKPSKSTAARQQPSQLCSRCGRGPHSHHSCPARGIQCNKCKHKGHFAAYCRSQSVTEVADTPMPEQEFDEVLK